MSDEFEGSTFGALMETEKQKREEKTQDTKISNKQDTKISNDVEDNIDDIRKVVKQVGRETSPLRITPHENDLLEDFVYSFKKQGIRTDKTQIIRIALNYILNDHAEQGEDSILTAVLERLNA